VEDIQGRRGLRPPPGHEELSAMAWRHIRELIIGSPLPSTELAEKRLDNVRALAALSPGALASVAYANQEIYLGLLVAGAAGLAYSWPIACVIAGLLALLSLSYMQTIQAYPDGGGSYAVAYENLGRLVGLVSAAGLLIDYVLNVAVSLAAGVEALASAFTVLWPYRIEIALFLLIGIMLINLRGVQESGTVMTVPVYLFLGSYLLMIVVGIVTALVDGPAQPTAHLPLVIEPLTMLLLLRTFASGATALTGVEAISNAVPVFKPPEVRHARQTMLLMALLMGVLFLGTVGATQYLGVTAGSEETILSALARRLFGSGPIYLLIQFTTLMVLVVAANTSFTGFPRVTAIMAGDGFLPRQLRMLGERLVYSNGIILLSAVAGLLIVLFGGDTHRLIPLFAVGAFLAYTLSQTGMVVHWLRESGPGWGAKALLNGLGALATGTALIVIAAGKFTHGAWIVILLIPLFVAVFMGIREHYDEVGRELKLMEDLPPFGEQRHPRIAMPVAGVHRGVIVALQYARCISDQVEAVYVELEPGSSSSLREKWQRYGLDQMAPLIVVPSPYRSFIGPFLDYLDQVDAEADDGQLTNVLIPEFVPARWWHYLLHNQTAWLLRLALLHRRHRMGKTRAIIDVPFHLAR
jgi:amino acid transporter